MIKRILPALAIAAALAGLAACGEESAPAPVPEDTISVQAEAHAGMVTLASAELVSTEWSPTVTYDGTPSRLARCNIRITNESYDHGSFAAKISIESEDGLVKYGEGFAVVNDLASGQSGESTVSTLPAPAGKIEMDAPFTCRVVSVDTNE